jgi:arginase
MNIQIIQVPYDSGNKNMRSGRGPDHFMQHKLDTILRNQGHAVSIQRIESNNSFATEIGTSIELNRLLSERVQLARNSGKFPLILAGNCNSSLGTIAGLNQDPLGILWLDAHGDFNTPETTHTGFLDGMGLAMAAGKCWKTLVGTIPGFRFVSAENIVHIGGRDLDLEEEKLMKLSQIVLIPASEYNKLVVDDAFERLKNNVSRIYLHIDIDVLDFSDAQANSFAAPGGLMVEDVVNIIAIAREKFEVCAAAITSYAPEYDKNDEVVLAGIRLIEALAASDG